MVKTISSAEYAELVKNNSKPFVLDFTADW